jgi:ribosomal protein S8
MNKTTNFLAILKAGAVSRRRSIIVPNTKFNVDVLNFFYERGYIAGFVVGSDYKLIEVNFRYSELNVSPLARIKILSKPGLRRYFDYRHLVLHFKKDPYVLFSTIKGLKFSGEILSDKTTEGRLGGEAICQFFI